MLVDIENRQYLLCTYTYTVQIICIIEHEPNKGCTNDECCIYNAQDFSEILKIALI